MNKIKKFIAQDDIKLLKTLFYKKYLSVTPRIVDEKNLKLRFLHCERVSDVSFDILHFYLNDLKNNSKKLSKTDVRQLKYIKKNKLDNAVIFLGYIHDLYKFAESKESEHGELAAEFFKNYCKRNHMKIGGHVKLMYDAIKNHSNKLDNNSNNIYYKILCDADLLSKYFEENIVQKMEKHKLSAKDEVVRYEKVLKDTKVKGKTPYFDQLQDLYKRHLFVDIKDGEYSKKGGK